MALFTLRPFADPFRPTLAEFRAASRNAGAACFTFAVICEPPTQFTFQADTRP